MNLDVHPANLLEVRLRLQLLVLLHQGDVEILGTLHILARGAAPNVRLGGA